MNGTNATDVTIIKSSGKMTREHKEAKSLANAGYTVTGFAWDRTGEKPNTEEFEGYTVQYWSREPAGGTVGHMILLIGWWLAVVKKIIKDEPTILHVSDLDSLLPALPFKIIWNTKLVYDICDFYSDHLPPGFPDRFKYIVHSFECFCMRFPDRVIIVDENRLQKELPELDSGFDIIMNCAPDPQGKIEPGLPSELDPDNLTIYYGGWISKYRGITQILNVVKETSGVNLVIAGRSEGEIRNKIEQHSKEYDNIVYTGLVEYDVSMSISMECDLIFAFYDPDLTGHQLASPNKAFDAMACSTPILTNSGTPLADLVHDVGFGWVLPYGDTVALRKKIDELKGEERSVGVKGKAGREAYEREYSWERMEKLLLKIYEDL